MPKKKDAPGEQPEEIKTPEAETEAKTETKAEAPDACEALKKELAAEKDQHLRLAAEYENYRKRSQRERDALFTDIKAETAGRFLPVYDNLQRALTQKCADEAFLKGIELTMAQLLEVFDKLGIKKIEAVNKPFDPAFHHAVMHCEDEKLGENTVAEEFQTGFIMGDKVIRFSMVRVAN